MSRLFHRSEESLPLIQRSTGPTNVCYACLLSLVVAGLCVVYWSVPSGLAESFQNSVRTHTDMPHLRRFQRLRGLEIVEDVAQKTDGQWALQKNGGFSEDLQFAIVAALAELADER